MTIQNADIVRPSRASALYKAPAFIPGNSQQQIISIDFGFANNPLYKQEKLLIFLDDAVYYQKLVLTDGKANAIKDDVRTFVVSGSIKTDDSISFETEVYPALPKEAGIDPAVLKLPLYLEPNTEIILRDELFIFYHFSCSKIIYRNERPYLQLRYLGNYYNTNIIGVLRKWHSEALMQLDNVSFK